MSLPRRIHRPDSPKINIWDIATKTIVFTGDTQNAAIFCKVTTRTLISALRRKGRIQRKWAVRPVKAAV
jgi:hypothetical protein